MPVITDDPRVSTTFTYACVCGTTVQVRDGDPDHFCCRVCGTCTTGAHQHRCRIELS